MGTQKTVPVDEPDDFVVTLRQPDGRNLGNTLEARESRHFARLKQSALNQQTCGIVATGKSIRPHVNSEQRRDWGKAIKCNVENKAKEFVRKVVSV